MGWKKKTRKGFKRFWKKGGRELTFQTASVLLTKRPH